MVSEGIAIQRHLNQNQNSKRDAHYLSKIYAHLVKTGGINRALRFFFENANCGALDLKDDVLERLNLKHPTTASSNLITCY